jgi:hypothetical protein
MSIEKSEALALLDDATRLFEEAKSLEEMIVVRSKAEGVRTYARGMRLGLDIQNRAAALRLRAARKAGELLASLRMRGGDRRSKGRRAPLKLADLGISRDQSKRWQRLAMLPEESFVKYIRIANRLGHEITAAGFLKMAEADRQRNRRRADPPSKEKHAHIHSAVAAHERCLSSWRTTAS